MTVKGNGTLSSQYEKLLINVENGVMTGFLQQRFFVSVVNNTAHVNLTMSYPFGKNLTNTVRLSLPSGSSDIQVSSGNYTIGDNTISWNETIDQIDVRFTPPIVLHLSSPKSIVGQGYATTANVTIENRGVYTNVLNVTVYANATTINQAEVTVTGENFTTVIFTWDTTGFAYGYYTISATATIVEGKTDISDITYTSGIVLVTFSGDVNGDRVVDTFDLFRIGKAYGATPSSSNWNEACDINGDNIIDETDLSILEENYGKSAYTDN